MDPFDNLGRPVLNNFALLQHFNDTRKDVVIQGVPRRGHCEGLSIFSYEDFGIKYKLKIVF